VTIRLRLRAIALALRGQFLLGMFNGQLSFCCRKYKAPGVPNAGGQVPSLLSPPHRGFAATTSYRLRIPSWCELPAYRLRSTTVPGWSSQLL